MLAEPDILRIGGLAEALAPVPPDMPGAEIRRRFETEPLAQALPVVDADGRPLGLITREAASRQGATAVDLMDLSPRMVDAGALAADLTSELLAAPPTELARGFIVTRDGVYMGVAGASALLRAATAAGRAHAEAAEALRAELDRARTEAQFRDESFHLLFDGNPVAMCVWDAETLRILQVNEAATRQYGYSRDEILALTVVDFMPQAERVRLARMSAHGGVFQDNGESWRHIRADGSLLDVLPMVRILEYCGRNARLGAMFDITKRKQAEDELLRTRSFLDAVVENVPQMLVVKEMRENRIVLLNRAGEELLGVSRDEVLGKNEYDIFPPAQAEILVARDREAVASGIMQVVPEEYIQTVNHGVRILETKKLAVNVHRDEPPFLLVVSQDITEQKRGAELLAQARDEAEAANLAKSEFLANMSHEIRTPLNGVLGVAGVLGHTNLDPRQREMVRIIETSASALNTLLSDILDIARVEAGQLSILAEPFAVADSVREVGDLFRLSAQAKGLELDIDIDPRAEATAVGDGARLKQILVNLTANAVKFTERGSVRLSVTPSADDPSVFIFAVADTGVGFGMDQKDALFDRFRQADGSITRRFGGSGLGLAISHSLAELMGGELDATSAPGEGSVFTLRLPMRSLTMVHKDPAPIVAEPQIDSPEILRVLVADDHATNRRVVELILAVAGADLVSVENGAEAVEAFQQARFDVVLMDMQMPVMDGLTAIREIRRFEAEQGMARTPIIALTANAMPEHVTQCLAAGADRHLSKPISPSDLLSGVAEVIDECEAAAPAPAKRLS